ncbi:MAG: alkaline shock response membrane anchor protein AmaP [Bacillota bacterium]
MSLADRVFLTFYSLCLALLSLAVVAMASGWEGPLSGLQAGLADPQGRWILGILGVLFFAFSVRFLTLGVRNQRGARSVVHETAMGDVSVSLGAIENLVRRVARQCTGVRDVRGWVRYGAAGLSVRLRLIVSPDVNIPKASEEVQKAVAEYVRDVVGVGVAEVRVMVENIGTEPRRRVE